jgi:hypothetical protein
VTSTDSTGRGHHQTQVDRISIQGQQNGETVITIDDGTGIETDDFSSSGEAQISTGLSQPCHWNVPLPMIPFPLSVGASRSQTSTCSYPASQNPPSQAGNTTDQRKVVVVGRQTVSARGVSCNAWTVQVSDNLEYTTASMGSFNGDQVTTVEFCEPSSLIFRFDEKSSSGLQATSVLQNAEPQ